MVKLVQIASFLALAPLALAAPAPAENVAAAFSFEQWAIDKSTNPTGNHLSVEEVIAIAENRTSADPLPLSKRAASCTFSGQLASAADAVRCIDYLAARPNQNCHAAVSATEFIRMGQARITGIASGRNPPQDTNSPCGNVARGAGLIMDACTRNGLVRGQNAAWGNGYMVVDIRAATN
ncbi:hypothetical protein V8F20_004430 [Naviculisporaceae sp. PSN 640]